MKRIYIETHGCSLNFSDTEFMKGSLSEAGYELVETEDGAAELIILNSCTVKDRTYRNFIKRLGQIDGRRLVIAGCIPAAYKDTDLLSDYSYIGPDNLNEIAYVVNSTLNGERVQLADGGFCEERLGGRKVRKNPAIEIVPVCRGCLGECSYCQTRLARGTLTSYPISRIVDQIKTGLQEGAREIWLTAQDLGIYGEDSGSSLPELLGAVLAIEGNFKLRLGMANPDGVLKYLDELHELYSDPRVFKFLHVPVQSGSDRVLGAMRRKYSTSDFINISEKFSDSFARFSISTDIIVGFPTESEEDFEKSLALLRKVRPQTVNRSRFSSRPFTPAAGLKSLHSSVVAERSRRLDRLVKKMSLENNKRWIGWKGEVLIDERKKPGSMLGRNVAYRPVVFFDKSLNPGDLITARIVDATTYHLIGRRSS